MKTKVFKSILPALAILMAIGLSFATELNTVNEPGYYNDPLLGVQAVPGGVDCPPEGSIDCTYNGHKVYADPAMTIELFERE